VLVSSGNTSFTNDYSGVLLNKDRTVLIAAPSGMSGEYHIASSVIKIEDSAFKGCSGLTSIKIPDSVTNIGDSAFLGCSGLTEIKIPDSVRTIGSFAFVGCSKLDSIRIPDSVTDIDGYVFDKNITIYTSLNSFAQKWAEENDYVVMEDEKSKLHRIKEEEERGIRTQRQNAGKCQHCGGELKGLFSKKCVSCGKPKDY
jgi:hypothetical protein